ncbi:MAG: hypothetical protein GXO96_00910 [Nitrospirae bacterium]|nr:hypothetical protein [Candidatus Manganitrophaceae bacterium]
MKAKIMMIMAALLVWTGVAVASIATVSGEITEIKGEMVTVKTGDGAMKSIHVDPSATKKEGMIKVGAHVSAEVNDKGHAESIKVVKK